MKKNSKKNQYEEGTERDVPNRSQATRKKRRDSKVEFENSNVTSAILLACKALTIVLQHGMVPRLGWDMNILEQRLPRLRDAIMNHRVKLSDVRDKTTQDKECMKQIIGGMLEREIGYLDSALGRILFEMTYSMDPQSLMEEYQIQVRHT